MSDYFWLREAQFERIKPFFTLSHGVPRVDDRRVVSGIIHVIRNGLRWRAAEVYRQHASQVPPDCRQSTKRGDVPRRIGRTKGGLNSKLHAVCDGTGRQQETD